MGRCHPPGEAEDEAPVVPRATAAWVWPAAAPIYAGRALRSISFRETRCTSHAKPVFSIVQMSHQVGSGCHGCKPCLADLGKAWWLWWLPSPRPTSATRGLFLLSSPV